MKSLGDAVRDAFEAHPDMMGGLLAVYNLGRDDGRAVLSRAAAPEPEWEYGCRSSAHREPVTFVIGFDVDEPEDHGFDCPSPALVRRRMAGPWEVVTDDRD